MVAACMYLNLPKEVAILLFANSAAYRWAGHSGIQAFKLHRPTFVSLGIEESPQQESPTTHVYSQLW